MKRDDIKERFMSHVETSDGCWIWRGARQSDGYGHVQIARRTKQAHRVAHELFIGPIPDGFEVDHLCGQPPCVRPGHLEAVTGEENRRRKYASITECKSGHAYDEANTYIRPNGTRDCRICIRDRARAYRIRRAAA